MRIELLEPGLALPKGRGYVGVGDADDEIFFPHIDSCLGVVCVYESGAIIGGHVGAVWPGMRDFNYAFCANRVFSLMEANRKRVNAGAVTKLVAVYPRSLSSWASEVTNIYKTAMPAAALEVDTTACDKGVDALVTHTKVTVVNCKSKHTVTYDIPEDDFDAKTFS